MARQTRRCHMAGGFNWTPGFCRLYVSPSARSLRQRPQAAKAEAGTGMGALGTNVATEIWGQVSVLKFKKTC
jgi:hypothetical protein